MDDFEATTQGVRDRHDLVKLMKDLAVDFRNNPGEWENIKIDTYLEAMSAWLQAADQQYQNFNKVLPEQPTWTLLAEVLLAASLYE